MMLVQNEVSSDRAIKHWKTYFDGFKPCYFPASLDGRPDLRDNFQESTVKLDVNDGAFLEFCSRHQLTPHSVFQTAWAIVIGHYAGVEDICFAYSTNSGEPSDLKADNLLVCRAQITAENLLVDTMADMMRDFDEASMHRKCSMTEIQKLLGLEGQQLFNSGLQIQHPFASEVGQWTQNRDMVKCDILARVSIKDDAFLAVSVRTRTSKFSAAQTADVAHTMGKALSEIMRAHPQSMIGDLDNFSQRDYEKVMSWNESMPSSIQNTFHRHFEDVVRRAPDAPAICSWDRNFTYHELDTLSTRLANNLAHLGVEPEVFVLICFNKTSIAYASMLSIFKAGGAFVAIDPSYQVSRIQAIVKATKASIVVAEPAHCHLFEGIMEHIIAIDPNLADELQLMPSVARPQSCPSNTAYAVFTSGSTGTPKGIMVEHRNLCTAALTLASPMRIKSTSRVLQFAAYTFDLSYGDIFVTLSQGGCICVPSEHERINNLAGAILRMNVNTACLIPSVARMIQPEDVPCLKSLLLGGEALVQENLELWAANVALVTLYGPSECTVWCTAQTDVKVDSPANSIGRGVGALVWIASATNHDRLCPIGCIGELLIEGPVVARGYFDDEQTKQSFIENPRWAEAEPGQRRRFYKTGDLARYKSDGIVTFIGRKDTQIKLHGRRIEMGEIEYHLSSHDLLRQSMVTLPAAGIYRRKLVAIVVLKTSKVSTSSAGELKPVSGVTKQTSTAEVAKIKEFLSSRVPSYMLPHHWIVVEDIPLMISGKMNRVLAKKFVESFTETEESPEETSDEQFTSQKLDDPLEIRLRNIWSHVLDRNVTEIGFDQDFVSLGGDSFAAMELVARCKQEGHILTVHDVLDSNTIQKMASMIKTPLSKTAAIGYDAQAQVSQRQDYSGAHLPLKFPPIWWDARPTLVGSVRS